MARKPTPTFAVRRPKATSKRMASRKRSALVKQRALLKKKALLKKAVDLASLDDVQVQYAADPKTGSVRVIVKRHARSKRARPVKPLSAEVVELRLGKAMLRLDASDVVGSLKVQELADGTVEVVSEETDDLVVDRDTEALLAIKLAQLQRGELELSGPWDAEAWKARTAEHLQKLSEGES